MTKMLRSSKRAMIEDREAKYGRMRRNRNITGEYYKKKKLETYQPCDRKIFNLGVQWFTEGLTLEDAPADFVGNKNFTDGFAYARRIKNVEIDLFNIGKQYRLDGVAIEDIPERYRDNPFVLKGYNGVIVMTKKI